MANGESEIMNGASLDVAAEQRARLKELFPGVITETVNDAGEIVESVDFEKLKAELGTFTELFENRRERYGMDWPGKKDALRLIQTPSRATLKPCRAESVNFDTTGHLFIEGDNLEVLKLLQKSYYGKIKMIYIDPPYNTGKEFIYPDNYTEDLQNYLEYAGLADSTGKKFSTNTANEGRFHTKWLNMMYPRLYLARNLLRDDGVIFISIDDNEVTNLRRLCDEVFGEENFVAEITTLCNPKGRSQDKYFATNHEYVLIYSKKELPKGHFSIEKDEAQIVAEYTEEDENGKYRLLELRNTHRDFGKHNRPNLFFPIFMSPQSNDVSLTPVDGYIKILPFWDDGFEGCWTWEKGKVEKESSFLVAKEISGRWKVYRKSYANGAEKMLKTIWNDKLFFTEKGQIDFSALFKTKAKLFQSPKSVEFIKNIIATISDTDDIILDFFAGSATTAHAVLDLNKQDGGQRKFILVQLPEPCGEDTEAFKAGYQTIADIGKERIRRVIAKLNAEQEGKLDLEGDKDQDRGFRVLKLDQSNFKQWRPIDASATAEQLELQLSEHVDHVSHAASQEDLLYEILLKAGFQPTEKVAVKEFAGIPVFSIAEGALLICLAETVTKELIDAVILANPQQFICLDAAFGGNDQLKANAVQNFKAHNLQKEKYNQIVFKTV